MHLCSQEKGGGIEIGDLGKIENRLLSELHARFPLNEKPFEIVADRLGLSEAEVIQRTERLIQKGVIRRVGYSIDPRKIEGRKTRLIAFKVPPERIDDAASAINRYREVSHNYLRDGEFNIWFTISSFDDKRLNDIVEELVTSVKPDDHLILPTIKSYKLRSPTDGLYGGSIPNDE